MTAVAYIGQRDMLRRFLEIYIGDETESGISQIFGDGTRKFFPHGEASDPTPTVTMREEHARALLQALIRHFDGGEDTRSLRRDYDAERKRVDLLIDKLVNVQVVVQ